ncbi:transcriptional regulator [Streptomyces sp. NPDC050161]|uniref:transcriptional regulator n=1 Tax=Streptomyces sp. NPDC050161 TaxID=3365604 RepID=UPI0037AFE646
MTQSDFEDGYDDEDDVPEWTDHVMATVAAEVRRRRKRLRISAQELSDACAELGHPIPRNVIANMESGRRATLPLVDVMVLAEALDTHPICLIYPVGHVQRVQRLPYQHYEHPADVMTWFTAENDVTGREEYMLHCFRRHSILEHIIRAAKSNQDRERWKAKMAANSTEREEALRAEADYAEQVATVTNRLRNTRASIRRMGSTPPDLLPTLADIDPPSTDTNTNTNTNTNTTEENSV